MDQEFFADIQTIPAERPRLQLRIDVGSIIVLTVTEDDQDTREGGNQDRELTDEEQQERDERREERRAERDAEREEEEDSTDSTDATDTTQPVTETTAG